ncbi:MAG: hypothetical protein ACOYZ8_03190 [Chloroflexota bacterium]
MKRILIATLALALTACSAVVTVQPTPVPPTAQVVIATVLVTAVPTEAPPTAIPTATPLPTDTPEPTPTEEPTEAAPTEPPAAGGPLTIDPALGGGLFTSMSASSDAFSLRCLPKEITFTVATADPYVVNVYLYYRIEDRQGTYITEWKNGGLMDPQEQGVFTRVFSGEDIHPDLRKHLAWFDVQFIGVNKSDEVVGRSEKIVQLITYTIDCQ